jgi:malate permease and related proteins
MEIFLRAIEGVLTLIIIGMAGYFLAYKRWFNPETKAILPKLVNYVALPPFLFYSLVHAFTRDELHHLIYGAAVPFLSMIACFAISIVIGRVFSVDKHHLGVFHASFTTSNSIFVGVPVTLALFGEKALPYTLLYFFANTTFFWTVGNYSLSLDAGGGPKVALFSAATLKRIFSGPMLGFLFAIVFILVGAVMPDFVMEAAHYLGNMTTPLALIFVGITLFGMDLHKIRMNADLFWVLMGRFVVSPVSIYLIAQILPIPDLMFRVFIIMASLPAMVQIVVLSSFYKSDVEYATLVVSVTTILSIFTIPLYMVLLG